MKALISTFFFLITFLSYSNAYDYSYIDKKVSNYPHFNNVKTLTIRISNDFNSDTEKARAIYTWIALNINYSDAYNTTYINNTFEFYTSIYQKNKALKEKEIKTLELVIKSKKANCYGYSLLYKKLCDEFNIETKIIFGLTKSNTNDIGVDRVIKDHAWNAVKINNKWRLLDVTWSAGFQDMYTKRFIKSFNDSYFFTSPDEFITHHYPAKEDWQLIKKTVNLKEFFLTPILYSHYFDSNLLVSAVHTGIIYISKNTKSITLYFDKIPKDPNLYYQFEKDFKAKKIIVNKIKNNRYYVKIKVKNFIATSLTIFNNEKATIGFKIETQNNNQ